LDLLSSPVLPAALAPLAAAAGPDAAEAGALALLDGKWLGSEEISGIKGRLDRDEAHPLNKKAALISAASGRSLRSRRVLILVHSLLDNAPRRLGRDGARVKRRVDQRTSAQDKALARPAGV
jgi:hypothetical protein